MGRNMKDEKYEIKKEDIGMKNLRTKCSRPVRRCTVWNWII